MMPPNSQSGPGMPPQNQNGGGNAIGPQMPSSSAPGGPHHQAPPYTNSSNGNEQISNDPINYNHSNKGDAAAAPKPLFPAASNVHQPPAKPAPDTSEAAKTGVKSISANSKLMYPGDEELSIEEIRASKGKYNRGSPAKSPMPPPMAAARPSPMSDRPSPMQGRPSPMSNDRRGPPHMSNDRRGPPPMPNRDNYHQGGGDDYYQERNDYRRHQNHGVY